MGEIKKPGDEILLEKKKSGRLRRSGDVAYAKEQYEKHGETKCAVCGEPTDGNYVYCHSCSGEATGDGCYATINDHDKDWE